ncbi:GTP-binding protein rhoA [Serendipita vermifera]|nr:GTP-binding protein rhoA [Serendipita vermifera]
MQGCKRVRRKLVIAGDFACGKTSLLKQFDTQDFSESYTPPLHHVTIFELQIDGHYIELAPWDTSAHPTAEHLRPHSYIECHVVLLCLPINRQDSLVTIQDKWFPEIAHFCSSPQVPVILVGCKKDLREPSPVIISDRFVSEEEGHQMARTIGAFKYMECSSKTGEGVDLILNEAARASLSVRYRPRRGTCLVL